MIRISIALLLLCLLSLVLQSYQISEDCYNCRRSCHWARLGKSKLKDPEDERKVEAFHQELMKECSKTCEETYCKESDSLSDILTLAKLMRALSDDSGALCRAPVCPATPVCQGGVLKKVLDENGCPTCPVCTYPKDRKQCPPIGGAAVMCTGGYWKKRPDKDGCPQAPVCTPGDDPDDPVRKWAGGAADW